MYCALPSNQHRETPCSRVGVHLLEFFVHNLDFIRRHNRGFGKRLFVSRLWALEVLPYYLLGSHLTFPFLSPFTPRSPISPKSRRIIGEDGLRRSKTR